MKTSPVTIVREAWHRLVTWCRQYHPKLLDALAPGASGEEIDELEQTIGQQLPVEVRESLTLHNGVSREEPGGFVFGDHLLDIAGIERRWTEWRGNEDLNEDYEGEATSFPEGAIVLDYANPGWIPMCDEQNGGFLGIDLSPGETGTVGQVFNFGRDDDNKGVLGKNWGEFLLSYAQFLNAHTPKKFDSDSSSWFEQLDSEFESTHPHDVLVRWTREGKWPLPQRSVTIDPTWRTKTVLSLARGTATDNDIERMPILGDALRDAGCSDEEILEHCRFCGITAVGCWLIDALLNEN